jgi:hypothetical protein
VEHRRHEGKNRIEVATTLASVLVKPKRFCLFWRSIK